MCILRVPRGSAVLLIPLPCRILIDVALAALLTKVPLMISILVDGGIARRLWAATCTFRASVFRRHRRHFCGHGFSPAVDQNQHRKRAPPSAPTELGAAGKRLRLRTLCSNPPIGR